MSAPDPAPLAPPPAHPERLVFLGTPQIAVPALDALVAAGRRPELVLTRADARRGRRSRAEPSPVKAAALGHGLSVTHELDDVLEVGADLGVVVAYGRIVPRRVLEALPMVNVHFSLLPRWRGAAPVERAILAGDELTGVCLMSLEEGLDTGPVHARVEVAVGDRDAAELAAELASAGARLLLDELTEGLSPGRAQVGQPTYADKITSEDRHLDWERPAAELARVVRIGGAWTVLDGRRLLIHRARAEEGRLEPGQMEGTQVGTGAGVLRLISVQPAGRARLDAEAWQRGARLAPEQRLGDQR